jgi:hypothetical protein
MKPIKQSQIEKAEEKIRNFSQKEFQTYLQKIESAQPDFFEYIDYLLEVFDDREDFQEKFIYYFAVLNLSYKNAYDFIPAFDKEWIMEVEDKNLAFMEGLSELEEAEQDLQAEQEIADHFQITVLEYLENELFDEKEDYDDEMLEFDTQIFWMMKGLIDLYDFALSKA